MNREIGLHIRCNQSILELIEKASRLKLPLFQCFLRQQSGKMIQAQAQEITNFRAACRNFRNSFVHASYLINLAEPTFTHHPALKQELYWARKLGFNHIILHPGSTAIHNAGIDAIVRVLNALTSSTQGIKFVLENVAFAAPSIGGSLEDLQAIHSKLDNPERVGFCIDTAHAYAYGYDLATKEGRKNFIDQLENTLGCDSIALIHINDTQSTLGSRHDMHCRLGVGTLGIDALKEFALDERLARIPLILELPTLTEEEEKKDIQIVLSWHGDKAVL
jgi:apurinic endonuclease APN1